MAISLYDVSVASYLQTLGAVSGFLAKGREHCEKSGIDLAWLRPREDFSYLSQPWIDFTHLPNVNESHVHFRGPSLGAGIPRPVVFTDKKTGGQASLYVQDRVQMTPMRPLRVVISTRLRRAASPPDGTSAS